MGAVLLTEVGPGRVSWDKESRALWALVLTPKEERCDT
jgi:hypothetical protein